MSEYSIEITLTSEDVDTSRLRVFRLRARERMNELYEVELDVACVSDEPPSVDDLEGSRLTVTLTRHDAIVRHFSGTVVGVEERYAKGTTHLGYRVTLAPKLWQATLVETLDVHVDKSVPTLIDDKLGMLGLTRSSDYVQALASPYAEREMIVQYRESDLAFLSRWCEHYGIFFFFEHGERGEVLHFGDAVSAYRPLAEDKAVAYVGERQRTGIFELAAIRRMVPKIYVCFDYYERTPTQELQGNEALPGGFGGGIIEYGGHMKTAEEAAHLARIRAEERASTRALLRGEGDDPRFAPGHTIEVVDHPRHAGDFVILEVEHVARQNIVGWDTTDDPPYRNTFTLLDAGSTFRPPRRTPVPRVHGLVSAVVETEEGVIGRDARIDAEGRYLVRFLFDTAPPDERPSSCRVRMMQASAGPSYGIHFPLKPGVEVAIAFLDGNPDRPVIAGAIPNPITASPVTGASHTMSRIQTRSGIVVEFEDATRGT